jgi:AmiR/NasT family two-component response regulator
MPEPLAESPTAVRRADGGVLVASSTAESAAIARLTQELESVLERNAQLERALESRVVIEQAKGVLAERLRLEPEAAFNLLRRAARSSRRRLHDLAGEVVASRHTPQDLARTMVEFRRPNGPR